MIKGIVIGILILLLIGFYYEADITKELVDKGLEVGKEYAKELFSEGKDFVKETIEEKQNEQINS